MSYAGYKRTFRGPDGRDHLVIKEATNLKSIADWIRGNPKRMEGLCPKCQRNVEFSLKHTCP